MVYISAIITHITHYKSSWTFCVGMYMYFSQSLLTANIKGMYHKPEGPAFCYVSSYNIFLSLNNWSTILWWSFKPTVAEWHFLWSRRSTTKPPRLDKAKTSGIRMVGIRILTVFFLFWPVFSCQLVKQNNIIVKQLYFRKLVFTVNCFINLPLRFPIIPNLMIYANLFKSTILIELGHRPNPDDRINRKPDDRKNDGMTK